MKECLHRVTLAHNNANEREGIWANFERQPFLRSESVQALKLDSKIKELIFTLNYLCETKDGIPYDELGGFVAKELAKLSVPEFKKKWIQLGKPPERVDSWVEYHSIIQKNLHRKLEKNKIISAIKKSKPFFDRYHNFHDRFSSSETPAAFLEINQELLSDLDKFLKEEPYLKQANDENSKVLYWDIDENYGGS